MTKKQTSIITLLSVAAIVLALLVSSRIWFRIDLTAAKAYTISNVSRNLAKDLTEPVQITYFVSDKLFKLYPNPGQINDLITEYTTYSKNMIRFSVRDPAKEGLDQYMQQLGIPAQQMNLFEKDEASVSLVYSGLLLEYLDRQDVIPVIFTPDTLEYDLTSRIRNLVSEREKSAGILIASPSKSLEQNFRNLYQYLNMTGYKPRQINSGDEIPANLSQLIVIGGADFLDDWALYRIDHYIHQGGKVIFLTESVNTSVTNYGMTAYPMEDLGLLEMLASYGADVKPALVLDKASITTTFQSPSGEVRRIRYGFWLNVIPEDADKNHPVTTNFGGADFFWANPIVLVAPNGIEAASLLTSTELGWLQTKDFVIDPDRDYEMNAEEDETRGKQTIAAALSGKFPSYWQNKEKPVREGVEDFLPDIVGQAAESRILVVANVNFVNDEYMRDERNIRFFLAGTDWLSNDDDIIGIRNRVPVTGGLNRIADPLQRLATMAFARLFNTVIIPLAVLIFGLYSAHKRKKRTEGHNKEVSNAV